MMKYSFNQTADGTTFEFENGTKLVVPVAGNGYVVHPAKDGVGEISFPIRHTGDVFHAFRMGIAMASNVPAHCRFW